MISNHYNRKWYTDVSRECYILADKKPAGNGGGTYNSSQTWVKRDLNTVVHTCPENNVSLSNDEFTLAKGNWMIRIYSTALRIGSFCIRLYDVTNDQQQATSINAFTPDRINRASANVILEDYVELSTSTTFRIDIWGSDAYNNTKALGAPTSIPNQQETFTIVYLYRHH